MNNLPLFMQRKEIAAQYDPNAAIVLYHGEANDLIDALPDGSIKLIITSPPYNLGKAYEDRVSIEKYLAVQAETIAKLHRILSPNGSICW